MANKYDLKGKKVLVTGSNGQLGRALVRAFLGSSAFVYATDLQDEIAEKPASKNYEYLRMDVTDENSVLAAAGKIKELDVLVNNAGIGIFTPFENRTPQEIDQAMDVNIKGTILCAKIFSRGMAKRKSGRIINVGSIYGVVPADKKIYGDSGRNSSEIYAATKAGVIHLTRYLAAYLGERGIAVNSISPGGIFNNQKESFVKNYTGKTPMGRMAQTADLVGAACFLASDDAGFVTGQNITIDGGFTLNQ